MNVNYNTLNPPTVNNSAYNLSNSTGLSSPGVLKKNNNSLLKNIVQKDTNKENNFKLVKSYSPSHYLANKITINSNLNSNSNINSNVQTRDSSKSPFRKETINRYNMITTNISMKYPPKALVSLNREKIFYVSF
jgi:hypothetical protein